MNPPPPLPQHVSDEVRFQYDLSIWSTTTLYNKLEEVKEAVEKVEADNDEQVTLKKHELQQTAEWRKTIVKGATGFWQDQTVRNFFMLVLSALAYKYLGIDNAFTPPAAAESAPTTEQP
mgnify:CR=1 FL=1